MGNTENGRGRLLSLLEILLEETDENHGLSTQEILGKLEERGFSVERKALYKDFEAIKASSTALESFGRPPRYYIEQRDFEVEEIMILIDAVESAGFMTEKKKAALIRKLKSLTSKGHAAELNEQIHYIGRHHSSNNDFIYTTNRIRKAMHEGHPVSFLYIEYRFGEGEVYKHDGQRYVLHPFALIWHNGFYYCIGARPDKDPAGKGDAIWHFRIDRMKEVHVESKKKLVSPPKSFQVARYVEASFSMYGNKPEPVQLRFRKDMLTQFYDRFSQDVSIFPDPENADYLIANVTASISPTFFSWVSQYEGAFGIYGPESVVKQYHEHLRKALET